MLSIDEILKAEDQKIRKVPCPEWSGDVYIRSLSGDEADRLEKLMEDGVSQSAALVGLSLCDENGKTIKVTPIQMQALGRKGALPLRRIASEALEINAWTEQAQDTIEKNSETTGESS